MPSAIRPEPNYEDWIENQDGKPGKVIVANDDDGDGDGVIDYADGYNWDPNNAADNTPPSNAQGEKFVPVILHLPAGLTAANAYYKIEYCMASLGPSPTGGNMRLWTADGDVARDKRNFAEIAGAQAPPALVQPTAPGEQNYYTWTQMSKLEWHATGNGDQWARLYLEGVLPSGAVGDQPITFKIDPDGAGPLGWLDDTVRTTAISLAFIEDSNSNHQGDANDSATSFVRFGLWDNAYTAQAATPADRSTLAVRNGQPEADNFVGSDSRRFYIRVADAMRNADPNVAEQFTVEWYTQTVAHAADDRPADARITLVETGPNTGVFCSRGVMLVATDLDANYPTNTGLASQPGLAARGTSNHRTRRAAIDGYAAFDWSFPAVGTLTRTATVFNRNPDERRRLAVRVVNYTTAAPATAAYIQAQFDHAQGLWTPAGVLLEPGPMLARPVPPGMLNAAGEYPVPPLGAADTANEVAALADLIPITPDNSLTVVFVPMSGSNAYTTVFRRTRTALGNRFFIFVDENLNLNCEALGHELFHALYNRGDEATTQQFLTFNTEDPQRYAVPLPDVRVYRRFHPSTIDWVRLQRSGGRFPIGAGTGAPTPTTGNTLVRPW
jgi:hypothetical protein